MPEGYFATFQTCESLNSVVDINICLIVLWAPSFALGHGSLLELTTTTTVQKETRIIHSNGRAVTMLPAPCMAVDQHPGPPRRPLGRMGRDNLLTNART